ncbi:hypothetical protein B0T20DRAFT_475581 [Sordaria brevicollis]|uniref:Autophagy-related protein 27 n=1 Tax=Sordaria brevicollis TaxID=83679 RepID=A0AAE0PKC9_SORBR|nr:hypothetical protein B0T20DRAFT_475581 [Sordaria brevicollis]
MRHRLSSRQALFFFLLFGLAAGQEHWENFSPNKISFPVCAEDGTCPVYNDGDTLHVNYTLGDSKRVERLVMSLVCMAMEDDDPLTRSFVLGGEALTVFSIEDDPDSSAGNLPFTIPAVPEMTNISPRMETAAALACVIRLKGECSLGLPSVTLQSDPFQLRAASEDCDERIANLNRLGVKHDKPGRLRPTTTGSTGYTYGHRPTFESFTGFARPAPTRPSFIRSSFVTTTTSQADPTTLVLPPEVPTEADRRAPEGLSKYAVGIGVGAAMAALIVGLMSFFPLRRWFRRWRWRRLDAKTHPPRGRPVWIVDQSGVIYPGRGNQRRPGMTGAHHANSVNAVHELHGDSRPVPELAGVPVESGEVRGDDGLERRVDGPGRAAARPDTNAPEAGGAGSHEERAAETIQERFEEVVEERSDGTTEEGIQDSTEERTEVMTKKVTAERVGDKTEEEVGEEKEYDPKTSDEMEKEDEERDEEKI